MSGVAFGIKNAKSNVFLSKKDKTEVEHDTQQHAMAKTTPAKRSDLSCLVVPTSLQNLHERRREKL